MYFYVGLLDSTCCFLKYVYVVSCLVIAFFWWHSILLWIHREWVYQNKVTDSSAKGCLGCFPFGYIMNELPWLFLDQPLGHVHSFHFGYTDENEIASHKWVYINFFRNCHKQFSKVVDHLSPLATHERLNYSQPLSTWFRPSLNKFSHSCVCVFNFPSCFNFQFSIDRWCWVSLHVLIGHLNIFFGKVLGVLLIALLEFVFLHSLDTYILQIFVRQTILQIFSPKPWASSFYFLKHFSWLEVDHLDKVQLISFYCGLCFCILSKKSSFTVKL